MIMASVLPAPEVTAGRDTDLELDLLNTDNVACLNVVVEFAVRRPLVLTQGDRRIELDWLGPGRRHGHPIRLRATASGSAGIILRTFSYCDVRGRVNDASGTILAVVVTLPLPGGSPPEPPPTVPMQDSVDDDLPSVFISHRSTDSPWFLGLVVDHLRRALRPHRVFVDTDLRGGQIWPDQLDTELGRCSALVALIGPNWRSGSEVLWREIRVVLKREILVIPVLFDGAQMPHRADLPGDISALADRHAIRIDPTHARDDLMRVELAVRSALRARQ